MIPYKNKKIENAVVFFAIEHRKKTKQPLYQTSLYKYLAFFDFCSIRETGQPALELTYRARPYGPVPVEIYENKEGAVGFKFQKDETGGEFIVNMGKPNLAYFSQYEIALMGRLIEIFAQSWITTKIMSDASHEDIRAWSRTWHEKPNEIIDYALEFEGDVFSKNEAALTYPEEVYLTYKAIMS